MIIDIVVILFILFSLFRGYSKGLVGILVSIIGFILAIVLALTLQTTVANYLNEKTQVGTAIQDAVKGSITQKIEEKAEEKTEGQDTKDVQGEIKNQFYNDIVSKIANSDEVDSASKNVTLFILKGISFVAIFIVVITISYILQMLLNIVFKLPILGSINKIGGLAISGIIGVIKIWIILAILNFVVPVISSDFLSNILNGSIVTQYLYDNNLIVSILSSNLKI